MDDSICFCVHEPIPRVNRKTGGYIERDLSSAARYGRIEFVLDSTDRPSASPSQAMFKINQRLKFFSPDRDFIFWAGGDVMALGLSLAYLASEGFDEISYLSWERQRSHDGKRVGGFYIPRATRLVFDAKIYEDLQLEDS